MTVLEEMIAEIIELDQHAAKKARERVVQLIKPPNSLDTLGEWQCN